MTSKFKSGRPEFPLRISAVTRRSDEHSSSPVYRDGGDFRRDRLLRDGSWQISLFREDLGFMFTILTGEKIFTRVPLPKATIPGWQFPRDDEEWIELGEEEVDHEPCVKFMVETPVLAGLDRKPAVARRIVYVSKLTNWLRREIGLNNEGVPRVTTDWLEVSLGPISPEIFDLPLDYNEISLKTGLIKKKED